MRTPAAPLVRVPVRGRVVVVPVLLFVLVLVLALAGTARAEPDEPRLSPDAARWVSIATTAAGLGMTAYLWHAADGREDGHGRAELQLASIGTGLATLGIGPATGLVVAGEYRRSLGGALARPLLVGSGALAIGLGGFIIGWGCFETEDCTDAKIGGGIAVGAGALVAAGGLAWAAYDIWDTPRIVRGRSARRVALAPLVGADRIGLAFTLSE